MAELTIAELVIGARQYAEDERTPFAQIPWTPMSRVIWSESEGTEPVERDGETYEYFLEPFIIVEQFETLLDGNDADELVCSVIRYARSDA